ncbi:glutathione S-transferase [Aspergillus alliaceus]|uniref:Glutathione S-transferase n=1 Tax=Petromyces alliaceus TaxID=209559 RepID=A0A5N7BVI7_PETAA|nr:glutathione S-transferase [Aspergillus alliaceus]
MTEQEHKVYRHADADGHFRRKDSVFRSIVSSDPTAEFPAEKDRYILYLGYGCPWVHRSNIARSLKGLEEIIPLVADPAYEGRYTIPVLCDKEETIVNNKSSEIIRMFYTELDHLLPDDLREVNKPGGGFYPLYLRNDIDEMNKWVYRQINNGVYKTGFATTQVAYEGNLYPLFEALDRIKTHLHSKDTNLSGEHITETDIRLYMTVARFDVAYYLIFRCNLKTIWHDYPQIHL